MDSESETVALLRSRANHLQQQIVDLRAEIAPLEFELQQAHAAIRLLTDIPAKGAEASRNAMVHRARQTNPAMAKLTMKQLVIKALTEHFMNGATANELLDFFALEWGRDDVVRTSLSPQLTRLKREGEITLEGKVWHLAENPFADPDLEREALLEAQADAQSQNGGQSAEYDL